MDRNETDHANQAKPWERPCEPEHPMILEGGVTDGDTRFMLRCMFEELLAAGLEPDRLREMSRDPNYQALYAARAALGDRATDDLLAETAARIGVHRCRKWESTSHSQEATLTVSGAAGHGRRKGT